MVVFSIDSAMETTRGLLTRWLIEIKPGVFVGDLSNRIRMCLWEVIIGDDYNAQAIMVYSYPSEQGYKIESYGDPCRHVCSFDGLQLIGNYVDRQDALHKLNIILDE